MKNKPSMDRKKIANEVIKAINKAGYENIDPNELFEGIDELYRKPSLTQVVDEEMPIIICYDLIFFQRYGIDMPDNPEAALFDLYNDKHGRNGLKYVYHSAKVWFRHLRFFLIDNPDQEQLDSAVDEFKNILEGRYFEYNHDLEIVLIKS